LATSTAEVQTASKLSRRNDRYATPGIEHKQIFVAADQNISLSDKSQSISLPNGEKMNM
jgi:hypothetical protein